MGKNFWPIYIIVAAVALAATWKFAPAIGEKMPPASRDSIRGLVATCMGRSSGGSRSVATESETAPAKPQPRADIMPVSGTAKPAAKPADKAATGDRLRDATARQETPVVPVRQAKPAATGDRLRDATARQETPVVPVRQAKPVAKPAPVVEEDDDLPSLKGIQQEDPNRATWGVLNQVTTVEGLDGEEKGAVAGGRIFLIESREQQKKTLWLVGNFSPTPMDEKVRVPATSLYCFSGNPDALSKNQRNCLRMYYQLRGEAITCKNKVLRENADKSPFGHKAAEAKKAFDAKAREVEASSSGDNPRAKNELSQLKEKYTALLDKHREWKEKNKALLKDPDKDPAYLQKLQEARKFAGPIAGMAF